MNLQANPTLLEEICFSNEEINTASFNSSIDDSILKTTVFRCLSWYSSIPLKKVTINVYHGYVILSGAVQWKYQRIVTSKMFSNVKGLRGIVNNIRVTNEIAL